VLSNCVQKDRARQVGPPRRGSCLSELLTAAAQPLRYEMELNESEWTFGWAPPRKVISPTRITCEIRIELLK
jgi:hypothetical protein